MYAKKTNPWVKILIVVLCLALIGAGLYLFDRFVDRSGWVEKNGIYYYRDFHGRKITGWQDLEGHRYYFGEDKAMATGWLKLEGNTYYMGDDGTLDSGWIQVESNLYHTDENSVIQSGWQDIDGSRYYFAKSGALHTGWLELDGQKYYMGEDGAMQTGFLTIDEKRYYFGNTGPMVTGHATIEDNAYYFREDGSIFTGWLEDGEVPVYYLPDTGALATGWQEVDGKRLYFTDEGTIYTGWLEDGEYTYYLLSDGSFVTGPMEIEGAMHYFSPKGVHLILVNSKNKVPDYYQVNLVEIDGWHKVSDVCFDALRQMLDDCKAAVGHYEFNSGYRSINDQYAILEARTQENMGDGRSYAAAKAIALQTVAIPGTSEHHLGLAVDILGDSAKAWLTEHCWDYGFIVRYQAAKSHITGIANEDWHFRYVGKDVALDMKALDLCLEEYVGAYVPPVEEAEEGETADDETAEESGEAATEDAGNEEATDS